jgi:hypothetical protein
MARLTIILFSAVFFLISASFAGASQRVVVAEMLTSVA